MGHKVFFAPIFRLGPLALAAVASFRAITLVPRLGLGSGTLWHSLQAIPSDLALVLAFLALTGGLAVGARGCSLVKAVPSFLILALGVWFLAGVVHPWVRYVVSTRYLGIDPSFLFPYGPHFPWSELGRARAMLSGELPVPNSGFSPEAMAGLVEFGMALPFLTAGLSLLNAVTGALVPRFDSWLSVEQRGWVLAVCISLAFLAGAGLSVRLVSVEAASLVTLLALPLVVPAAVLLALTACLPPALPES